MARKKKPEIAPLSPEQIEKEIAEIEQVFSGGNSVSDPEIEPELPAKYKDVYERMAAGMGIFEDVNNPNSWLRKNMLYAKQTESGLYQFNGYLTGGKPTNFKLIKKK